MPEQRPDGCQNCKKPCTVFFTQIVGTQTTKLAMCSDCPNAKQLQGGSNMGLLSQILGMLTPVASPMHSQRCPVCGLGWSEFQKTQLLGCPSCYESHAANLAQLLPRIQPGAEHNGKVPSGFHRVHAKARLDTAREELQKAISTENYEYAAKLRDEIKSLEQLLAKPTEDQ
ncbi:MAG: UvrB/UvrC motif-containing protein [Puniceicoccales bacterium]|jgi:protein arginine kinase activator|nr:UvrB/UvrC motif-containing protein [Puniceicoccales bacterium]